MGGGEDVDVVPLAPPSSSPRRSSPSGSVRNGDGRNVLGGPEEVTPARSFFVRMVAQRELEVDEDAWFKVLEKHGVLTSASISMSGSALAFMQASRRIATSNAQIVGTPLSEMENKGSSAMQSDRTDGGYTYAAEESARSIFQSLKSRRWIGRRLPILTVLSPFCTFFMVWQYMMMTIDFTYTAFWVPYSVVFVLEDCEWDIFSALIDFIVGSVAKALPLSTTGPTPPLSLPLLCSRRHARTQTADTHSLPPFLPSSLPPFLSFPPRPLSGGFTLRIYL